METNIFYNKPKRKGLFSAIIGGIMTVAGIILLVFPLAVDSGVEEIIKNLVMLASGGVLLIAGFCLLISGMTQWLIRPYAVVFTKDGLYDFTGKHKNGMFVEWNNVKDARVYGKGDSAFIGIDLISLDIAYKSLNGKQKREICENISNGMPALMIHQNEVTEPIGSIVKTVLQIRLGKDEEITDTEIQSDIFVPEGTQECEKSVTAETAKSAEMPVLPDTDTPDEAESDDISEEKSSPEEPAEPVTESTENEDAVTTEEKVPENTEEKRQPEKFKESASIDDLLAMLSIGDEK